MKTFTVLIIGPYPPPKGGMSIHIERLSRRLDVREIGHAILDESRPKSPNTAHLRSMGLGAYFRLLLGHDIVHIHSMNPFVRLGHTVAARMAGRRVVQTLHAGRAGRVGRLALRLAGAMAHERIAVGEALAGWMGGRAHVVAPFIPPDPLEEVVPDEIARWLAEQEADGRRIIAANASKVVREGGVDLYGIDMIVDAFACREIHDRFAAIVCVGTVPGDDAYLARLLARAAAGPAAGRIRLVRGETGFPGVLRRSHLFVRPSSRDGDAISLREALWYGIPAIASDAARRPPGTILFPARDVGRFVDAILGAGTEGRSAAAGRDFADEVIGIYRAAIS